MFELTKRQRRTLFVRTSASMSPGVFLRGGFFVMSCIGRYKGRYYTLLEKGNEIEAPKLGTTRGHASDGSFGIFCKRVGVFC